MRQPRIKVICSRELADDYVVGVVFIYECKTWDIFIDYGVFTRFGFTWKELYYYAISIINYKRLCEQVGMTYTCGT